MTILKTRKIVLGLLVMLVLAFGVQGNPADAITKFTASSGDLKTYQENQPFTVSFSVGIERSQTKPNHKQVPSTDTDGNAVTIGTNAAGVKTGWYDDTAGDGYQSTDTQLTYSAAHNYDEEAIDINVTGGANVTKIGRYDITPAANPDDLTEGGTNATKLSSSVTIILTAAAAAEITITISDQTDNDDRPTGVAAATNLVFTVYVVDRAPSSPTAADWQLTGLTNGYKNGGDDYGDDAITTAATGANYKVEYTVVSGSGRLYLQKDTRKGSAARTLSASSAAVVHLDMNGTTNTVRATIPGQQPQTGIFIFGYPTVAITSGNGQEGLFNGRLEDPLVVRVTDGKRRVISGLAVDFDIGTGTNAMFIPVSGTSVYTNATGALVDDFTDATGTETATSTHPAAAADMLVQTDSRGEAKTYFQLGDTTTETSQTVTAAAGGESLLNPFRFTAGSGTRRPTLEILSGDNQRTDSNGDIDDPLVVVVRRDGNLRPGEQVTFRTIKGTLSGYTEASTEPGVELVARNDEKRVWARTNGRGQAQVTYYQDPGAGSDTVTATISGSNYEKEVIFGINGAGGTRRDDPPPPTATNTITLTLSRTTGAPGDDITVEVDSSPQGVLVNINSGELSDSDFSRLSGGTPFTSTLTLPSAADRYTFSATRSGFTRDSATVTVASDASGTGARLSLDVAGTGATRTVTVAATNAQGRSVPGLDVTLRGTALTRSRTVRVGTPITLTLSAGTLEAAAQGFETASETITIGAGSGTAGGTGTGTSTTDGTLSLTAVGGVVNGQQTVEVSARDAAGRGIADLTVSLSGSGFVTRSATTLATGSVRAIVALPDVTGSHILYAMAAGYTTGSVTLSATGGTTTGETPATGGSTPTGSASSVRIRGQAFPSGSLNTPLTQPLVVRVLDGNGNGVSNTKVTFRVTSGRGRLSQRGNGTANIDWTNVSGDASTPYTPLSASSTVQATAAGVSQTVTFTITTGSVATTPTIPRTPVTTGSVVHIAAASRPPMVWVDNGAIYALVGSAPERFVPGVTNAQNIAVAGDKIYWTARTSSSSGTIHSANMDGTGAKQLASRPSVPKGIAVDTTRQKLFWTTSAGSIERSNLDGTGVETVRSNLFNIQDIAIAGNGNPYWTQGNGSVRFVNIAGQTPIWNISSGAAAVGSLTLADGKVYWTERTGISGGTINRANLNGSGKIVLATIQATPIGVAVDTARSYVYWTNTGGRLQRRNLAGNGTGTVENVVEGLRSPADMVLSNSIMAPPGETAETPTESTPTASASKYDINGDGSVDSKDSEALTFLIVAGETDTKYDVNGDGSVDINDVTAVIRNRTAAAASAPSLLGVKLTAVEIDRLQAQIDLLITTDDRSPAAIKTLIYLQQLIATARPEKTQLLANYPNPFNPETWIPYELATDTDVRITIYNAQGVVIRTLHLGQQSAGYYTDRERAAYWDGRNALGEQVASGVYFYQFETDTMSAMRKMVILK